MIIDGDDDVTMMIIIPIDVTLVGILTDDSAEQYRKTSLARGQG